jgi:hypothetical protein
MATMIYDIPALPGLDIQVGYPVQRGSQSDQEFAHIELTDILPKHWSFWMTSLMDISSEGGLRIPLPASKN